jgi:hypothetical protein
MLVGLSRGKLDREFKRPATEIEDLLTSVVFGSLVYAPMAEGLLPFLGCARSPSGALLADRLVALRAVVYDFWPGWDPSGPSDGTEVCAGSEPELVLRFERDDAPALWVLVEAKLWSGKSSHATPGGPVNDQLGKYWVAFEQRARAAGAEAVAVVYVTRGVIVPEEDFAETQRELAAKGAPPAPLYWLSWRHFELALRDASHPMMRDVAALLRERWGLAMPATTWTWPERRDGRGPAWSFECDWPWPTATTAVSSWSFAVEPTPHGGHERAR